MKAFAALLLIASAVAAASCAASASSRDPFRPVAIEPGAGIVYVFRAPSDGGGEVDIYINQRRGGRLAPGEYLYWFVPAETEVFVRVESGGSAVGSSWVDPGSPVFFEVTGGGFGRGMGIEHSGLRGGRSEISRTGLGGRRMLGPDGLMASAGG